MKYDIKRKSRICTIFLPVQWTIPIWTHDVTIWNPFPPARSCDLLLCRMSPQGVPGLAPNWVTLALNGTNLGLFKISFIIARRAMKCYMEKKRICLIWGKSEVKPAMAGLHHLLSSLFPKKYTSISDLAHFARLAISSTDCGTQSRSRIGVGVGVVLGVGVGVGN